MEYNIETILEMYEDDYNPSSKVPGPRNMYGDGGITEGKGANKGTFHLKLSSTMIYSNSVFIWYS